MSTSRRIPARWALLVVISFCGLCRADAVDLSQFPPDSVWRCANSKISSRKDADGTLVWRWEITGGAEAFLWLNEESPVHRDLPKFSRFIYDVNFAEGQINQLWPRTVGQLSPPNDKVFCEWNQFYFTHPHKTWITYQQVLDHPNWYAFPTAFSQPPPDVKLDRAHVLGFACLAKSESCVVELRNCRLLQNVIRVAPPYLTNPIGWPKNGVTPYFVKNLADHPVDVKTVLRSQHALFDVKVEPSHAAIPAGQRQRFDVIAAARRPSGFSEETAVVNFVPDGDESVAYRTETFCTTEIPATARRMVVFSPQQVQEMKQNAAKEEAAAEFWMSVSLEGQTEIPHGVGHMLVAGLPVKCPACKQANLHADENWLEVKCDHCGHTETHSMAADAIWIATWSAIHGAGDSPLSLGRAYLASGDEKYAKQAIKLMKLLAGGYAKLPWHNAYGPEGWSHEEPASPDAHTIAASTRWGNSPSYGTNFMVQHLAELHNAIVDSPSWSPQDRDLVRDGFWVPVATELMKITPGVSNMNDIINHDLVLAALNTGDANMLYRGTLHPMGVIGRMKDISQDGFSDEGCAINYHWAAAREWFPSIELLLNSRIDFEGITNRAVAALKMPVLRASLNGLAYCTGNSGTAWFNVPLDADVLTNADRVLPQEIWPRNRQYSTEPTLFRDAGWAVLRHGDTVQSQVMVNLDYGRSHGHGDLDRMNLGILAFGVPLSADPGSTYNYNTNAKPGPAEASMTGPFVANTVVVDARPQLRGAGRLISWDPRPELQRVTAQVSGIYPGVDWRRSVAIVDGSIGIVVDDLRSNESHRYESAWHHYGVAMPGENSQLAPLNESLGDGPYKELLNPKRITGAPVMMDWKIGDVHLRLWQFAHGSGLSYIAQTGVCWDNVRGLPVDGLFTRREGKTARFVAIFEPYKSDRALKNVSVNDAGRQTIVTLEFTSRGQREIAFVAGFAKTADQPAGKK